jgi:hypothetical protein
MPQQRAPRVPPRGLRNHDARWGDAPPERRYHWGMPTCRECNDDDVEKLVSVKVDGKARKVCADCADRLREEGEIAEASESVVQNMMGFKGRR